MADQSADIWAECARSVMSRTSDPVTARRTLEEGERCASACALVSIALSLRQIVNAMPDPQVWNLIETHLSDIEVDVRER